MKVIVISSAPFVAFGNSFQAYSPYIKEMEIWARHSGQIAFACPFLHHDDGTLLTDVSFPVARVFRLRGFDVKSIAGILKAIFFLPFNIFQLFRAMAWADHIHLRCPGNLSLLGCIVQIFFPKKPKTAKYAGNWDPNSPQPLSYRLQKKILNSQTLTKNIKVLVYGRWEGASKNIVPFFTATYRESEKLPVVQKDVSGKLQFLFVGTLSSGKRPLYALRLIAELRDAGFDAAIDFYGSGAEHSSLESEIAGLGLSQQAILRGNRHSDEIRKAYRESHFLILPSKSEGWPKVVAEAMFWGCVPIASAVSCVPFMLGFGERGIILEMSVEDDVLKIRSVLENPAAYADKVAKSVAWSRQFTLDLFENQIKEMLRS